VPDRDYRFLTFIQYILTESSLYSPSTAITGVSQSNANIQKLFENNFIFTNILTYFNNDIIHQCNVILFLNINRTRLKFYFCSILCNSNEKIQLFLFIKGRGKLNLSITAIADILLLPLLINHVFFIPILYHQHNIPFKACLIVIFDRNS